MPSGMAAEMRALVATENVADDELELAPLSKTGYKGVVEVGLKYQARIQVPGDGRGGTLKRRQYSVPGLFDTAKEAAIIRAAIMKGMMPNPRRAGVRKTGAPSRFSYSGAVPSG